MLVCAPLITLSPCSSFRKTAPKYRPPVEVVKKAGIRSQLKWTIQESHRINANLHNIRHSCIPHLVGAGGGLTLHRSRRGICSCEWTEKDVPICYPRADNGQIRGIQ